MLKMLYFLEKAGKIGFALPKALRPGLTI